MKLSLAILSLAKVTFAKDGFLSEIVLLAGHDKPEWYTSPLPHTYIADDDVPGEFTWMNVDGKNYLTHLINQHIPQYCGSCWAFSTMSAFADRIKIARKAEGMDINLSIQYILNCGSGTAGSCYGGYHTGAYQFIKDNGFIPYDTCQPYIACSSDSSQGFCDHVDTSCNAINTCVTCSGFDEGCTALNYFPNATVAEYGTVPGTGAEKVMNMKKEIHTRGPVAVTINASPLKAFTGGKVFDDDNESKMANHVVSIVGWGKDNDGKEYWHVRNSWGYYWGEEGFFRVATGKNMLGIEDSVAWATPGTFTTTNVPCSEDGAECGGKVNELHGEKNMRFAHQEYVDPSVHLAGSAYSSVKK